MAKLRKLATLLFVSSMLISCSSIEGERYIDERPALDLFDFFEGDVKAWGIVQDRSGNLLQKFVVDIDGSIETTPQGRQLVLDETFTYIQGEGVEKRVWTITPTGAKGAFTGAASDILGTASGQAYGNAFQFTYQMDLPVAGTEVTVNFDDWFWAMDDDTLFNRSAIKKFGVTFAEVTIFMQRQED